MSTISKAGFVEPQPEPVVFSNHIDMHLVNTNFQSLNEGILSVARNVGHMHKKVEKVNIIECDLSNVRCRINSLETTLTTHTKMLTDIFELLKQATQPEDEPVVSVDLPVLPVVSVDLPVLPVVSVDLPVLPVSAEDDDIEINFDEDQL
jgi:hypothetical protein